MRGSDPWDDDVYVAVPEYGATGSGLDSFDDYAPAHRDDDGWDTTASPTLDDHGAEAPMPIFTVTNPPGTVSATAMIGGRIRSIDIYDASRFSETQLAEEIVMLAELAKEKAQAAQHATTVELMRGLGHDRAGTSAFLQHAIDLPAPGVSATRMAEVFAAKYPLLND